MNALDINYINSLPQPFTGREIGGYWWPIYDIDVESGLLRIDVCGQVKHIDEFTAFLDDAGDLRSSEAFYTDANDDVRAVIKKVNK